MSRLRVRRITAFLLLTLVACSADGPSSTEPSATTLLATSQVAAWRGEWSEWSTAVSAEAADPGAASTFNTAALDGCPFISPDGRQFYMASTRSGGLGGIDIWVSRRDRTTDPWGEPQNLGAPVNSSADDFCPTMSRDGHTLYFVSRRAVGTVGIDYCGGADIYVTRAMPDGAFTLPENLGCSVNSAAEEFSPFPLNEPDRGPVLYFSSTRPGLGTGGDLYVSDVDGGRHSPAKLVPGVNSASDDGQPNVSHNGLELYFYSNRVVTGAKGGNDIYVATRTSTAEPWSTPRNLGQAINSAAAETRPSLSWDGQTLYFGSTRAGGEGGADIYVSFRQPIPAGHQ